MAGGGGRPPTLLRGNAVSSELDPVTGPDPDLKFDRCIIDYKTTNLSGVGAKSG